MIAFALLALLPNKFDVLFVASFAFAIVGLGVILFLFQRQTRTRDNFATTPVSIRSALKLLVEPRFRGQVSAATFLGLATISDSFVFLILQRQMGIPGDRLSAALRWHLSRDRGIFGANRPARR